MRLHVFGTGSAGNAYLLKTVDAGILLDAGIPIKRMVRGFTGVKMHGCLVTHEHGDHIKAAKDLAARGIDVYMTKGTADAAELSGHRVHVVKMLEPFQAGCFEILPFPTQHDAAEPCGYIIRDMGTGETLLYATDTYYLRNTYTGIHYWLIECNYCEEIVKAQLNAGQLPEAMKDRLLGSHMSLRRLIDTLNANDLTTARKIILCHLSDERSDEARMVREVKKATGIETIAAQAGTDIRLDLTPF